jgi:N-acetyl-gamma-glutamyl-phosphate reductase
VRPLVDAGLLEPGTALSATSLTGYSGGGKKMIEAYESASLRGPLSSPRPYGLALQHKHLPEMTAHSHLATMPVFQPIVASFYKGLAVSVPLHLDGKLTGGALHAALASHYRDERFVRVQALNDPEMLDEGFFDVQACNDTNRVDLFVFASRSQAILMARLDNLGKGASGAAVQTMNLHLGIDEGLGL